MSPLPGVNPSDGYRTRRWDALVLGSGLSALVASIRLGMAGQSVLLVEEEAARTGFPGLREPFFLAGAQKGGVLDACLRELTLPLIDRRRLEPDSIAYQVVGPHLRMDVGEAVRSCEELATWGLASPDAAHALIRALSESAEAERQAMLGAPLVRAGRRLTRGRSQGPGSYVRGLPAEVAGASADLSTVLHAQVRALSNLATASPSPEAQARLLGSTLAGGAGFRDGPPWLLGLLRKRFEAVYGEFRSLSGKFEFVSAAGHAGIAVLNTRDLLTARALVVAVPGCALEAVMGADKLPDFMRASGTPRRRVGIHLRVRKAMVPEAMSDRVILLPPDDEGLEQGLITLSVTPGGSEDPGFVNLVAQTLAPADVDRESGSHADQEASREASWQAVEAQVEKRVRTLLPFAKNQDLIRQPIRRPRWDDDGWLEDPPPNGGWPGEIDLQVSHRPRIYRLQRSGVAGLGFEGDLLMGWRSGDAIAGELQ